MSTKNIALDINVYRKLAGFKGESESFSKAVERLVDRVTTAHTGSDILNRLQEAPPAVTKEEHKHIADVIENNRQSETWSLHDLS